MGFYQVLKRIFGPRPKILLEMCSSGGNRFDLGMLCFAAQIWASEHRPDRASSNTKRSFYFYPQSAIGAHVSAAPHTQTLRNTPALDLMWRRSVPSDMRWIYCFESC